MLLRAAAAVALAAALAPSSARACSGTLTGAATGAFDCTVTVTPGKDGHYSVVVAPSGKIAGVERFLPATFEFAGRPMAGTYTLATFSGARASLQTTGNTAYRAGLAAGRRQGEVTLSIDTVEREARGGVTVSGRMNARLVPAIGTGPPVVVVVDF